ncbi:MAG: hypothetical protein WEC33_06575, partial [Dehalococcoidia bacterium]
MLRMFQPRATRDDAIFAEAVSLLDDGLDVEFLLGLYPEEAAWLEPELRAAASLTAAYSQAQPSYFFEGSLKAKFLAIGRDRAAGQLPVPAEPITWLGMLRGASAALTVVGGAALLGVVMLGFVTADEAVPGDWNYSFKLAGERFEYTTSRGEARIDFQIEHTQNRVQEIQKIFDSGENVSAAQIETLEREARDLASRLRGQPVDAESQLRLTELGEVTATVLSAVREKGPELGSRVDSALDEVSNAVSAGTGSTGTLPTPTATPAATAEPTATPVPPEPTAEPTNQPDDP